MLLEVNFLFFSFLTLSDYIFPYIIEAEYEKQLSTNEELANILEKTIRSKRRLEEDHEQVLKSNDELFAEAQRLNDEESIWIEDKETLDSELKHLRYEKLNYLR